MNCDSLDNQTECFLIINVISLIESLRYKHGFIPVNTTINLPFHFINPFVVYKICSLLSWNEMPRFVSLECINLIVHGTLPPIIIQGFLKSPRFTRGCKQHILDHAIRVYFRFTDPMPQSFICPARHNRSHSAR
jgi:hypothetical protein